MNDKVYYDKLKYAYETGWTPYPQGSNEPLENSINYYIQLLHDKADWYTLNNQAKQNNMDLATAWIVLKLDAYNRYDNRFKFYAPRALGRDAWFQIVKVARKVCNNPKLFDIIFLLNVDCDDIRIANYLKEGEEEIDRWYQAELEFIEESNKWYRKTRSPEQAEEDNLEAALDEIDNDTENYLEACEELGL